MTDGCYNKCIYLNAQMRRVGCERIQRERHAVEASYRGNI